jgi:hypothetical protein
MMAISMEELICFIKEIAKNALGISKNIATDLKKSSHSSFHLDKAMADPANISSSDDTFRD